MRGSGDLIGRSRHPVSHCPSLRSPARGVVLIGMEDRHGGIAWFPSVAKGTPRGAVRTAARRSRGSPSFDRSTPVGPFGSSLGVLWVFPWHPSGVPLGPCHRLMGRSGDALRISASFRDRDRGAPRSLGGRTEECLRQSPSRDRRTMRSRTDDAEMLREGLPDAPRRTPRSGKGSPHHRPRASGRVGPSVISWADRQPLTAPGWSSNSGAARWRRDPGPSRTARALP
jgi:hypothetical protein